MNPERTCIVCRTKQDKRNLIRIAKNKNGKISVDKNYTLDGRGAYICQDTACYDKLIKTKALNRAFKQNISQENYEEIIKQLNK